MSYARTAGAMLLLGGITSPALALDFSFGEFGIGLTNRVSIGGQWRIEDRDPALLGKLNLNPSLCEGDDCISFSGDPAPNQRLVDAPGGFFADKVDDGNWNYDVGDIVAGVAKLTTDLSVSWRDFNLKARGIAFFDAVNTDFDEFHPNNVDTAPPGAGGYQPEFTRRDSGVEDVIGNDVRLQDLALSYFTFLGDRGVNLTLGQAKIRWGEANLIAVNALNEINPPDLRGLRQPGGQINEIFQPVPLIAISGDVFPDYGITAEAFYQLQWKQAVADPGGAFFADIDALYRTGSQNYAAINLGQFPEDPLVFDEEQNRFRGQHRLQFGLAPLLTDTSFSSEVFQNGEDPVHDFTPSDDGQFGVRVNWFADMINGGTDLGFYFMRYHSRLPYLSFFAADRSPLRDTPNAVGVLTNCSLAGNDCFPIDTARAAVDYPEDITMYGISFSTNVGKWSVSGEYSFRPDLPVQVNLTDIFMAALQPGLPEEDIVLGAEILGDTLPLLGPLLGGLEGPLNDVLGGLLGGLTDGLLDLPITVPGARSALPDFLETVFRGNDDVDQNIAERGENYLIRGYERQKVGQFAMTGIRILGSSNPIASLVRSEQIITLIEVGFTHIVDMPSLDVIQFEGNSPNRTHFSPGADGTGTADGEPDARRLNPTQQTDAFADEFSWGYRIISFFEYNDVIFGLNFKPFLAWFHDVHGYAPFPMQNFVEDRKEWLVGTEVQFGQRWGGKIQYNGMHGNRHFSRRDRDNILAEITYTF